MDKLYIQNNFILFIKRKIPLRANAIKNISMNKELYNNKVRNITNKLNYNVFNNNNNNNQIVHDKN